MCVCMRVCVCFPLPVHPTFIGRQLGKALTRASPLSRCTLPSDVYGGKAGRVTVLPAALLIKGEHAPREQPLVMFQIAALF